MKSMPVILGSRPANRPILKVKQIGSKKRGKQQITAEFPAPFPSVTSAHIAGPKPGLDGTALLRASTRVQSVPLRPGNIGNTETLGEMWYCFAAPPWPLGGI